MRTSLRAGLAGLILAGGLVATPAALAGGGDDDHGGRGDDVRVAAACSEGSRVSLKLSREDRGVETEVEVDENRNGSIWRVRILVAGRQVAVRRGVTRAPSGSVEVRAVVAAPAGARVRAIARRAATGEVCRVTAAAP